MRIALVVGDLPTTSETFIVDKILGLIDRGLDVHVVCMRLDLEGWHAHPDLAARPEVLARVHRRAGRDPRGVGAAARLVSRAAGNRSLRRRLLALRRNGSGAGSLGVAVPLLMLHPDVVHFEFGWLAQRHAGLAPVLGAACSASFRGADLNYAGSADPDHYAAMWPHLSAIHCLGRDLWERAQRRGCPTSMPHALIPPAIDTERFRPVARPTRRSGDVFRLLSVSRLHWKKGIEHGLEAVRRLVDAGVDVEHRIVGSGPHEQAVRACIRDLGLDDRVSLLGECLRAEVRDELARADAFVHPAVSEGFCNAVLEAQAMEVPVVVSDADGLSENVADGRTGYVVPRRDGAALAGALARIAADPDLARRLGVAGRERVSERFRPVDQIDAFVEFYEALAAGRPDRIRTIRPAVGPVVG